MRAARRGRPATPARARTKAGGSWRGDMIALVAGGIIVAALALMLQTRWSDGFPVHKAAPQAGAPAAIAEIRADGPLRINEIMTSNRGALASEDGESPDWVELINQGERAVELGGYALAKTDSGTGVFTFPALTLQPQECVLVYADSRLRAEAGESLHAPFRLSSAGDTLMLFSPAGTALDTVNIPALGADEVYLRADRESWQVSADATPGLPNTAESMRLLSQPAGAGDVTLSELVASNASALADEDGQYYDYIELHNRTGEAVELTGWYLSDDASQPRKWRFPETRVEAGGYLVVFASGLNRLGDPARLHTNFSLSAEGEVVVLSDAQGRMLERIEFGLMKADQAWSLSADGSWQIAVPTPGAANP